MNHLAFWGDDCKESGDSATFTSTNRVQVYPGKFNYWLVVKTANSEGTIEDFAEEFIVDPLDTSGILAPPNVYVLEMRKLAGEKNARDWVHIHNLIPQAKTPSTVSPKMGMPTGPFEYYMVTFNPHASAPTTIPYPIQGCVEKPGWYVAQALSDKVVTTGGKAAEVRSKVEKEVAKQMRAEGKLTGSDIIFRAKIALGLSAVAAAAFYAMPLLMGGMAAKKAFSKRD